ncbi:MAG: sulfotransferase [Endozoicomonadaceae bacterium]|nr:sulfotransferase [Endozoicomonadaceae bacterium]
MLEQIKKIIIIIGCQRSGTTLLGHIMGAPEHALLLDESDVIQLDERGGFNQWYPKFASNDPGANQMLSDVFAEANKKYIAPDQRIVDGANNNFVLAPNITHLVLKAPNMTYSFNEIAKLKIPISIIYMIRDPRSVVASMLKLSHINFVENQLKLLNNYPLLLTEFKYEIAIMADKSQALHLRNANLWIIKSSLSERFIDLGIPTYICKYENLITNIGDTCHLIAKHCRIPFHELMLSHQTIYQGIAQGQTSRTRSVDKQSLNKWESSFNGDQQQQILTMTKAYMRKLGYN